MMPSALRTMFGPFALARNGRFAPADPGAPPAFTIVWRKRLVTVEIGDRLASPGEPGTLVLEVALGQVPSTGVREMADARLMLRAKLLSAMRVIPAFLPDGWSLRLMPDHTVLLRASRAIEFPVSISELLSEVALFVLALDPYLDVVEEEGLAAPSTIPVGLPAWMTPVGGMANTWPG